MLTCGLTILIDSILLSIVMLLKLDWLPLILIDCGVTILARHLVIFSDLTHFWSMLPFYTPWKHQKNKVLLVFSGGIKLEHWPVNLNAIIMPSHFDWAYRLENKVSAYVKKNNSYLIHPNFFINRDKVITSSTYKQNWKHEVCMVLFIWFIPVLWATNTYSLPFGDITENSRC